MKTIDRRIIALEAALTFQVPGTQLVRVLNPEGEGVAWTLALGGMGQPKHFFTGRTIEEVVGKAESAVLRSRVANRWSR